MKYNLKLGIKFDKGLKNIYYVILDWVLWFVCILISILGIKLIGGCIYNEENFGKVIFVL